MGEHEQGPQPTRTDEFVAEQLANQTYGEHHPSVDPALFEAWRERHDPEAGQAILEQYGRFALKVANYYGSRLPSYTAGIDTDDLAQQALLSLLYKAAIKFDPGRGYTFLTLASIEVRGDVIAHLNRMISTVRLPDHVRDKLIKIRKADKERQEQGLPPLNDMEAADIAGVPKKGHAFQENQHGSVNIAMLRVAAAISESGSLETDTIGPVYGDPQMSGGPNVLQFDETRQLVPLGEEPRVTPEEALLEEERREAVHRALDRAFAPVQPVIPVDADEKERRQAKLQAARETARRQRMREILEQRHGFRDFDDTTLAAIGARIGVGGERVRQIYNNARDMVEESLRQELDEDE